MCDVSPLVKLIKKLNMSKLSTRNKNHQHEDTLALSKMGYTLGKVIGEGTYSKVCVATARLNDIDEKLACKVINKKYAGVDFIRKFLPRELKIIRTINHPNIVNVYEILEVKDTIYIFMDYCRNGDLLEYVRNNGPISEERAKNYFRQIARAVDYLHGHEIAHRDLKCENILITLENIIKLGDFGFARSCIDEYTGKALYSDTFCGSAAYAAPEILQGIAYDPKMYDMWALGCILYIMLSASMPYDNTNITKMLKSQLNRSISFSSFTSWSKKGGQHLKNLLSFLLEPNTKKRANIKEVVNCLWLKEKPRSKRKVMLCSVSETSVFKF